MVNILKKLFNVLKYIVPILFVGALAYTLIFRPVKDQNNVANIISLDKVPSDTLRDGKGQLHAQKEFILIPDFAMAEAIYKAEIDSLRGELKLAKDEKIASMGIVTTSTETTFKPKVDRDTNTQHVTLSYKSKWADVKLSSDTAVVSKLMYRDSLIFTTILKPYGFLKLKEKQYIDVKSANKDVKQIGVTFFQVAAPKNNRSKFGIGFGVGPGLSFYNDGPEGIKVKPSWVTLQAGIQYRF